MLACSVGLMYTVKQELSVNAHSSMLEAKKDNTLLRDSHRLLQLCNHFQPDLFQKAWRPPYLSIKNQNFPMQRSPAKGSKMVFDHFNSILAADPTHRGLGYFHLII